MECKITGQKVLGSDKGNTAEYTHFEGGWTVGDSLELIYKAPVLPGQLGSGAGDLCLTLQKPGHKHCTTFEPDVNPFTAIIPIDMVKKRMVLKSLVSIGWKNIFSLILKPDEIVSSNSGGGTNLRLTQYSEGKWDGVYTDFHFATPQKYVRVFTFDCRSSGDNVQKFTDFIYTKFK